MMIIIYGAAWMMVDDDAFCNRSLNNIYVYKDEFSWVFKYDMYE